MNTTEILLSLTPENYNVPQAEERLYHVVMEVRQFDPNTGARKSKPVLHKFGFKEFRRNIEIYQKQGFTITVLHDPENIVKTQAKPKEPLMKPVEKPKTTEAKKQTKTKEVKAEAEEAAPEADDLGPTEPIIEFKKV